MSETKWQKARIVKRQDTTEDPIGLAGREIWVKIGQPRIGSYHSFNGNRHVGTLYDCNLLPPPWKKRVVFAQQDIELLPEFASEVDMIPWDQWGTDVQETAQ